jgi:hypothetical protein
MIEVLDLKNATKNRHEPHEHVNIVLKKSLKIPKG